MFQRGFTGIDDDVILEIDDLFKVVCFNVNEVADARGHGFEEPDMNDGRSEIDMPHAFSSHATMGNFHAATVANHPFMFGTFVLTAGTFPIAFRTKDPFTEQTVFFGSVSPVVDGFRFFDFAERPAPDIVRRGQRIFTEP